MTRYRVTLMAYGRGVWKREVTVEAPSPEQASQLALLAGRGERASEEWTHRVTDVGPPDHVNCEVLGLEEVKD